MKRICEAFGCFNAGMCIAAALLAHMWQLPALLDAALWFAMATFAFFLCARVHK